MSTQDPDTLLDLFPALELPRMELVAAAEVPPPYHELLVHTHHMTVTVEKFHGDMVDVRVLHTRQAGDWYARRILLTKHSTGEVVQFGQIRIHLPYCSPDVRAAILAEDTPVGRILIEHGVLLDVVPLAFVRVMPGPALTEWFGAPRGMLATYGRIGSIHFDEKPAVEVLEIVAPMPPG